MRQAPQIPSKATRGRLQTTHFAQLRKGTVKQGVFGCILQGALSPSLIETTSWKSNAVLWPISKGQVFLSGCKSSEFDGHWADVSTSQVLGVVTGAKEAGGSGPARSPGFQLGGLEESGWGGGRGGSQAALWTPRVSAASQQSRHPRKAGGVQKSHRLSQNSKGSQPVTGDQNNISH